jgi:hypothetical protein
VDSSHGQQHCLPGWSQWTAESTLGEEEMEDRSKSTEANFTGANHVDPIPTHHEANIDVDPEAKGLGFQDTCH